MPLAASLTREIQASVARIADSLDFKSYLSLVRLRFGRSHFCRCLTHMSTKELSSARCNIAESPAPVEPGTQTSLSSKRE